ncbi:MAG TPA: nickel pincer cofactor biosynthesis protein LarB [Anaerohalosphaeraceae bacterium]|nr:nickel pincer cofactor biosynthesis protein LarB [Phycisphaerae bacterium]HOL31113.1 nickel pincer cofactor biosynthesis protein LarB [Anaerohalosphaeraceae bacterium]HOM74909.1 nickel pincer cofactor biosynthesis protein LarB [Anaerohalosphaeraceae bacterium]HPC63872.1 nickel pincer cofactor biosynthesis protein LarB [Anaerohalosphaeraceae bacterium]HPO68713.1 nickel pincer cofactor biosynthesis protein LarB [Anaerohalosphaeraceae bacterium]
MNRKQIETLLTDVREGRMAVCEAVERLRHLPFEDIGFAKVDHHRSLRCGFPEVIYCPGKTVEQIAEIFQRLAPTGHTILATRASAEVFERVKSTANLDALRYEQAARIIILQQRPIEASVGRIVIVTAGTADMPAAEEARVTAQMLGQNVQMVCDVGVAGLHRLLGHLEVLRQANVVIVVAGMEGALASVVGGLVDCPVIAVPTSVGYGASFEGLAALLAMLNSCAAGVTVVNIDNGFGAAYAASLINMKIEQSRPAD